jgi:hypothetical protein
MYDQLKTGRGHDLFPLRRSHSGRPLFRLDGQMACLKYGHLQDTNSVQRFLGCHEFFSHGGETKYPDEEVDLST